MEHLLHSENILSAFNVRNMDIKSSIYTRSFTIICMYAETLNDGTTQTHRQCFFLVCIWWRGWTLGTLVTSSPLMIKPAPHHVALHDFLSLLTSDGVRVGLQIRCVNKMRCKFKCLLYQCRPPNKPNSSQGSKD